MSATNVKKVKKSMEKSLEKLKSMKELEKQLDALAVASTEAESSDAQKSKAKKEKKEVEKDAPPPSGLVDTESGVQALAAWLLKHPDEPIAFDAEGVDLCRDGRLCLVQLSDGRFTWLVDIVVLGKAAFENGGLKKVLESDVILKVGYDGRADADALFGQFGVRLTNMYDVQIASCKRKNREYGRRSRYVHGLKKAIGDFLLNDPKRANALEALKEAGKRAFAPEHGGSYDVWVDRPLPEMLIKYAEADVSLLLEMKKAWEKFSPVTSNVASTTARIRRAVNGPGPAKGKHMALRDF